MGPSSGALRRGAATGTELCMRAPRAGCGPLLLWRYDGRMGRYQPAEKMARGLTGDDMEILWALDLLERCRVRHQSATSAALRRQVVWSGQ